VRHIFLGFLMVFLDINFTIDQHVIGLIPDFAGYILVIRGLDELSGESDYIPKARNGLVYGFTLSH